MKKITEMLVVMLVVLFSASFALAGDPDIKIGIDNKNYNTNTADANAQAIARQKQLQQQLQQQAQMQYNQQTTNFNDVREHVMVQPGPQGNFVDAPIALVGNWTPLLCSPLFKSFSVERIRQMKKTNGFWNGVKVSGGAYVPFNGEPDELPVNLVGWDVREGAHPSDELLGEYQCRGEYGMPMGAALGVCLKRAKLETNTHRVFAAYKLRRDPKNSGFSIGSGAAGAKMMGDSGHVDEVAGALSLGGLIGKTRASVDEAYDWYVLALNDGPLTKTVTEPPCAPPVVQLPPQPEPCDPTALLLRIDTLKEGTLNCPDECLNNELLWKQIGDANMDLWYCTGNPFYLHEAIYAYGRSERNFLEGREPSGKRTRDLEGAQAVLYRTHYNWALAVRELHGREAELSFAKSKELHLKGDRTMPESQADMKR